MYRQTCKCVYDVTFVRMPFPDTGTADCMVCGDRIGSWGQNQLWPKYKFAGQLEDKAP